MKKEKEGDVKILGLAVRDFCRLTAVEIQANGESVVLSGKNAQGKSSVIRAIESALLGASALPKRPVREGAESAEIVVTLGDGEGVRLVIERTTDGTHEKLSVRNAAGVRQGTPQRVIDSLLGGCVDPIAFMAPPGAKTEKAADAERARMLAEVAPIPLDLVVWASEREAVFEDRTDVNRDLRETEARIGGRKPQDVPARVDIRAEADSLSAAEKVVATRERAAEAIRECDKGGLNLVREIEEVRAEAHRKIEVLEADALALADRKGRASKFLEDNPAPSDLEERKKKIASGAAQNEAAARIEEENRTLADLVERRDRLAKRAEALTLALADADAAKSEALGSVKMPAEGLAFTEGGVTLNGRPFSQGSTSEQIRASVRVAAAMAGRLRVILVRDGNALDPDSMAELLAFAKEAGLQLWVERVAKDVPACVEIVGGAVAGDPS